jgi:hypothetical protein
MDAGMKNLITILFPIIILLNVAVLAQVESVEKDSRIEGTMLKAPYLIYDGDNTEMLLLWQLSNSDTCVIEWGRDTSSVLGKVETIEYDDSHQHTYTFSNLLPGTKYYYKVSADSEIYSGSFFSAPDTNETNIRFMVYGDTRSFPEIHDQVAGAMVAQFKKNDGFQSIVLSVGDLVSNGDKERYWDNQFFDPSYSNIMTLLANVPYQAAIGNHEGSGQLFVKYFPYPFVAGRYWSFDYGPAHFVMVDQYTNYEPRSAQLTWIENDLASTAKPWKFIYLHEPGWSAGTHENNVSVQDYIQPLCEQYDVPIVFAGHNHCYARAVVNGIQHVTTGGGGAPLYVPDPDYPNVVAAAMANHFCNVEIHGDSLHFAALKPDSTILDEFFLRTTSTNGIK